MNTTIKLNNGDKVMTPWGEGVVFDNNELTRNSFKNSPIKLASTGRIIVELNKYRDLTNYGEIAVCNVTRKFAFWPEELTKIN